MTSPRRPPFLSKWRETRRTLGFSSLGLIALAIVSVLGALTEAAVLSLVVLVASAMSSGADAPQLAIGPLALADSSIGTLLTVALALTAMRTLLQLAAAWLPARISTAVQARVRAELFTHFVHAAWPVQAAERDGHLQEMMSSQANNAGRAVLNLATGLSALLQFSVLVGSAVLIKPAVAVIALLTGGLLFLGLRPLTRLTRRMAFRLAKANLGLATGVSESVRMAEEIYVFGAADTERERIRALILNVNQPFFRTQLLSRSVVALYQGVVLLLLVTGLGVLYVIGTRELSLLGAVVLILVRSSSYGQVAQAAYQSFHEQLPSLELITDTAHTYSASIPVSGSTRLTSVETITAAHVSFAYREDAHVLHDVSFETRQGEVIGIVGPSGAGKSTLVQLLLRLRVPTSGSLLVNGQPASSFSRHDWFRLVAYVPQDSRLVTGTVTDNIRFHRPWISEEDAIEAARRARVYDEVMMWERGFDSIVGQRADAVSGGQRQRLAIARALAGKPQVLVLDEPTSSLDNRSEALVHETIENLRGSTTTFLVSHRLAMLAACDRVMVFVDGELQAFGTPDAVSHTNDFLRASVVSLPSPNAASTPQAPPMA